MQEQVNADLIDGPLARLPSGKFVANAAWLTLAAIAHHLLRAPGYLASAQHGRACGASLRRQIIGLTPASPGTAAATWSFTCLSTGLGDRSGPTSSTQLIPPLARAA